MIRNNDFLYACIISLRVQILDQTNHISIASNLTLTSHNLTMTFISIEICSTKLTDNNVGDYSVL